RVLADLALDALSHTHRPGLLVATARAAADATHADLALLLEPQEDGTLIVCAAAPTAAQAPGAVLPASTIGVRWPAPGDALPIPASKDGVLGDHAYAGGTLGVLPPGAGSPLLIAVWQRGRDLHALDAMTALLHVAGAAVARL